MSCVVALLLLLVTATSPASASLQFGYYQQCCPLAEFIVDIVVCNAVQNDPSLAASLIKMHYLDCVIRGCDASLLLNYSADFFLTEKDENFYLRGYDVIDRAKAWLEMVCPGVVSCADIIAFAARDAAKLAGGIIYQVPGGRRDGLFSSFIDTANKPVPYESCNIITSYFTYNLGLSVEDMVALLGAHSIGVAHCASFNYLPDLNTVIFQNPTLNPWYAAILREKCPADKSYPVSNTTVPLNPMVPAILSNQFYQNVLNHYVLFLSDQCLLDDPNTSALTTFYAGNEAAWAQSFANAMVKMGNIGVLTGSQGEIRKQCWKING